MSANRSGKTLWLAIAVFAAVLAVVANLTRQTALAGLKQEKAVAAAAGPQVIPVKVQKVEVREFNKALSVYGKVEARQSAYVSPKVAGTIESMPVEEGDYVEKDKTILFKTESVKLEQKVRTAQQSLAMVSATEKERLALLKKAEVDFDRKLKSFNRYESLLKKSAVSQEVYDNKEAEYLTAAAELEHKKALYNLGLVEAGQARINLEMARKDLTDSTAIAPISGIITEKLVEMGEMGQPGKPVFKIDNTHELDISAYIPAEFSAGLQKDQTEAEIDLYGQPLAARMKVTYISPVVDPKLHIFEIKCRVTGGDSVLKPGQSVQLRLFPNRRSVMAVPVEALVRENDAWALFVANNGLAQKLEIKKGEENHGWVEVSGSSVLADMRVICEGQGFLKNHTPVKIIE